VESIPYLCRTCLHTGKAEAPPSRCAQCGSPRILCHPELSSLSIAHIDCDAFYASVEKRDDPGLRDKPLIIGGGTRGVVSTCCYLARQYGVHSAMPMFTAKNSALMPSSSRPTWPNMSASVARFAPCSTN
jgi:DNA polymerase-4